jgi:beta-lactamase regulating signal transducer with metallopeptidase domain
MDRPSHQETNLGTAIVIQDNEKLTTQIASWVAGQPFNNVLLLAIFVAIGWIGHYSMTTAIPAHLQQIQQGYESLTESHREERERTQQLYDKWMNRTHIDASEKSKIANAPAAK